MSSNTSNEMTISKLKSAVSITEVISKHIPLTSKGQGKSLARCPFHNEKTASFTVNESDGFFYCFGCSRGGDVFKFIQEYHNIDFIESAKKVAEMSGIKFDPAQINQKDEDEIQATILINNLAKDYYHKNLSDAKIASDYLTKKRGLSSEIIKKFEIGYAKSAKDDFFKIASKSFNENSIIKSGLVKKYGSSFFDFFNSRIIIPIKDHVGEVVGFGGRLIDYADGPKYLNSSENLVFKKREILFNLGNAKQYKIINRNESLIIVEGYMDVISLDQFGFHCGIAPLGTSITDQQIKKIFSLDKSPIFCLNSDNAGKQASMRAIEIMLPIIKIGIVPRFIDLSPFKDVDEMLRNWSADKSVDEFKKRISNAKYINDMIWDHFSINIDFKNPNELAILEHNLYSSVDKISNIFIKNNYKKFFKTKIYEETFRQGNDLSKRTKETANPVNNQDFRPYNDKISDTEFGILALLILFPGLAQMENSPIESIIDQISEKIQSYCHVVCQHIEDKTQDKLNIIKEIIPEKEFAMIRFHSNTINQDIKRITSINELEAFSILTLEKLCNTFLLYIMDDKSRYHEKDISNLVIEKKLLASKIEEVNRKIDAILFYN